MTTIDHQQAAVEAGACVLMENDGWEDWPSNSDLGGNYATGTRDDEYRHEKEALAKELITAATPHLRAAWEQELADKVRARRTQFRDDALFTFGRIGPSSEAYLNALDDILALLEGGGE